MIQVSMNNRVFRCIWAYYITPSAVPCRAIAGSSWLRPKPCNPVAAPARGSAHAVAVLLAPPPTQWYSTGVLQRGYQENCDIGSSPGSTLPPRTCLQRPCSIVRIRTLVYKALHNEDTLYIKHSNKDALHTYVALKNKDDLHKSTT